MTVERDYNERWDALIIIGEALQLAHDAGTTGGDADACDEVVWRAAEQGPRWEDLERFIHSVWQKNTTLRSENEKLVRALTRAENRGLRLQAMVQQLEARRDDLAA